MKESVRGESRDDVETWLRRLYDECNQLLSSKGKRVKIDNGSGGKISATEATGLVIRGDMGVELKVLSITFGWEGEMDQIIYVFEKNEGDWVRKATVRRNQLLDTMGGSSIDSWTYSKYFCYETEPVDIGEKVKQLTTEMGMLISC